MSMQKPELATHLERPAQFWLVGSCAFTSMASMRICDAMLPVFARDFSVTPGQAAGTISAFALAYGLLQLFYGPLGDRLGKTRVIGLATLACTAASCTARLSTLVTPLGMLIITRGLNIWLRPTTLRMK